jgi:hypothetical protein
VQQIVCEIEEAAEGIEGMRSTNYNDMITRIESSCLTCHDCNAIESPLLPISSSDSIVSSPIPINVRKRSHNKMQSNNHSNKGSANQSHKFKLSKMEISIKVVPSFSYYHL